MAIKPILFNTEMVRAILDGRKDVTLDVAMAEIRCTVDAYDEYFQTGRKPAYN